MHSKIIKQNSNTDVSKSLSAIETERIRLLYQLKNSFKHFDITALFALLNCVIALISLNYGIFVEIKRIESNLKSAHWLVGCPPPLHLVHLTWSWSEASICRASPSSSVTRVLFWEFSATNSSTSKLSRELVNTGAYRFVVSTVMVSLAISKRWLPDVSSAWNIKENDLIFKGDISPLI